MESGSEKFVVQQVHSWEISPAVGAGSLAEGDETAKSIAWDKRDLKAERARFTGYFDISSGPLSELTLTPTNCGAGWVRFGNERFGTIAE